jgi:DNA-directed RNA polymerase specialized sigma24 family protein
MDDGEFVRAMYDASYRRLVGQLVVATGSLAEAEDAVQEAFTRALNHARTFRGTDNPEAWLRVVAMNVARLAGRSPAAEPDIAGLSDGSLYVRDTADRLYQAAPGSWKTWSQVAETPAGLELVGSGEMLLGIGGDQHTVYRWARAEWQVVD